MILINVKEKVLIDSKDAEIYRVSCFDDLAAYHNYLVTTGHEKKAQCILKKVVKGEKVITKMIEEMQKSFHTKEKK